MIFLSRIKLNENTGSSKARALIAAGLGMIFIDMLCHIFPQGLVYSRLIASLRSFAKEIENVLVEHYVA